MVGQSGLGDPTPTKNHEAMHTPRLSIGNQMSTEPRHLPRGHHSTINTISSGRGRLAQRVGKPNPYEESWGYAHFTIIKGQSNVNRTSSLAACSPFNDKHHIVRATSPRSTGWETQPLRRIMRRCTLRDYLLAIKCQRNLATCRVFIIQR